MRSCCGFRFQIIPGGLAKKTKYESEAREGYIDCM